MILFVGSGCSSGRDKHYEGLGLSPAYEKRDGARFSGVNPLLKTGG